MGRSILHTPRPPTPTNTPIRPIRPILDGGKNVVFVDHFVSGAELALWLEAADIFVTPYPNPDQIVSGTLAYATGAGKAVVSTPYTYAVEMLDGGRGRLVPAGSCTGFAEVLIEVLRDADLRNDLGRRAYEFGRTMIWPEKP